MSAFASPKGAEIPQTANGDKMMMMIAQNNCDDLQGLADFPQKGILQFFVYLLQTARKVPNRVHFSI